MFSIKLVRHLFFVIMFKVVGFTILFMLYFAPKYRIHPNENIVFEDLYQLEQEKQTKER